MKQKQTSKYGHIFVGYQKGHSRESGRSSKTKLFLLQTRGLHHATNLHKICSGLLYPYTYKQQKPVHVPHYIRKSSHRTEFAISQSHINNAVPIYITITIP